MIIMIHCNPISYNRKWKLRKRLNVFASFRAKKIIIYYFTQGVALRFIHIFSFPQGIAPGSWIEERGRQKPGEKF